jgi:thioredoxin 1
MAGNVTDASDDSFEADVLQSAVPVLVDFWAPWCGPCKSIAPVLEQLANEYSGKVKVVKVNVDDNSNSAIKYNVRGIPNLIIFKDGKVENQIVGAVRKEELVSAIEKVIA